MLLSWRALFGDLPFSTYSESNKMREAICRKKLSETPVTLKIDNVSIPRPRRIGVLLWFGDKFFTFDFS